MSSISHRGAFTPYRPISSSSTTSTEEYVHSSGTESESSDQEGSFLDEMDRAAAIRSQSRPRSRSRSRDREEAHQGRVSSSTMSGGSTRAPPVAINLGMYWRAEGKENPHIDLPLSQERATPTMPGL